MVNLASISQSENSRYAPYEKQFAAFWEQEAGKYKSSKQIPTVENLRQAFLSKIHDKPKFKVVPIRAQSFALLDNLNPAHRFIQERMQPITLSTTSKTITSMAPGHPVLS